MCRTSDREPGVTEQRREGVGMVEELRPEDLEELVQELAEESGSPEPSPPEVEELLRELQSGSDGQARREAAEQLGKVGTSSHRIVRALIAASDPHSGVSREAAKSLRAPVHQEYFQQHPDRARGRL